MSITALLAKWDREHPEQCITQFSDELGLNGVGKEAERILVKLAFEAGRRYEREQKGTQ